MNSKARRSRGITLVELLAVIAVLVLLVALLLPSVRSARPAAQRNLCLNNLKQISLALMLYEAEHGTLPPAYTVDAEGNRLHSWRTLVLPYLEKEELFESIDLSKPWDDSANAEARKTLVEIYQCPSVFRNDGPTTYVVVVGPDCMFSGEVPHKSKEVTDRPSETIMLIDASAERAVHWMSPQDISPSEVLTMFGESKTNHPGIYQAAFLDGHVHAIQEDIDPEILRAWLTIAGGESLDE